MLRQLTFILLSAVLLAYPFAVYFGLNSYGAKAIGLLLLIIVLIRFAAIGNKVFTLALRPLLIVGTVSILISLLIMSTNNETAVRLNPVAINFTLFAIFSHSLIHPPSFIERIARLSHPELPAQAVQYTHHVTLMWTVFFLLNGCIALYTTLFTSLVIWTIYNGLIAYLLIGCLFAIEFLVRKIVMRRNSP